MSRAAPSAPTWAGGARAMLRPSVEPFAASDGHVYLMTGGARAEFVVRDASPRDRALLAALDGRALTAGEALERLRAAGVAATGEEVVTALAQLAELGLVSERSGPPAKSARHDRQLAWLRDRFGSEREVIAAQRRLTEASVAVLGCGGLGSWTLAALACTGIGRFVVVDDDEVELSNLNRQILFATADVGRAKVTAAAEALRRFDPGAVVEPRATHLRSVRDVEEAIAGCDFVVETADRPMYELPRWVDRACRRHAVPHISAAQHPPVVRVGPLRIPGRSACLECVEAHERERYPLLDEVAAFRSGRDRPTPTLGPASALVGSLIATEILHALTGAHPPATLGRSWIFRLDTFEARLQPEPLSGCEHTRPTATSCVPPRPAAPP